MAAQYVGYIGQFQQGQTMTLMLRSVGYSGQLVMPDAPPSATIYDDSGNAQVFSLPASDQANSIFSLPIFSAHHRSSAMRFLIVPTDSPAAFQLSTSRSTCFDFRLAALICR